MILPIPFEFGGKLYREAELRRPSGAVQADARKAADKGEVYEAMIVFVGGCLESLEGQTDRAQLRILTREMPYADGEYLAIQAMIKAGAADDIEGVYPCPRCHRQLIIDAGGQDKISDLPVRQVEEPPLIVAELETPAVVEKADGEELFRLDSLALGIPTLGMLSKAFARYGFADQVRLQFAAYVEATVKVNGQAPDGRWRTTWGMMAFERMDATDVNRITRQIREFGMETTLARTCPSCGKEWRAEVDTAGFFASGLRG